MLARQRFALVRLTMRNRWYRSEINFTFAVFVSGICVSCLEILKFGRSTELPAIGSFRATSRHQIDFTCEGSKAVAVVNGSWLIQTWHIKTESGRSQVLHG